VARLAGDEFDTGDGLVLGLVGQHRPVGDVADGPDPHRVRPEVIGFDKPVAIWCDSHRFEAQALRIRTAAYRQQHVIGLERLGRAAGDRFEGQLDPVLAGLGPGDLGAQAERHPLARERPLQGLGDLGVHARGDAVEILHHRHLGPQTAPD